MKHIILPFVAMFLLQYSYAQTITKTAAVPHTTGAPTHTPSTSGSEIAFNTTSKQIYTWNGSAWVLLNTLPSLTSGSVLFSDGTTIAQSNANFFWDNTNKRLGINTATPSTSLDIVGPSLTGSQTTGALNIAQTWNTTGAPNLIYGNVTNTASTGSTLIKLDVGGGNRFTVNTIGALYLGTDFGKFITPVDAGGSAAATGSGWRIAGGFTSTVNSAQVRFSNGNGSRTPVSGTNDILNISETFAAPAGSANYRPISINYTLNNSGAQTGTATGIFLNATETALKGMTHNLINLQTDGSSKFRVTSNGETFLQSGSRIWWGVNSLPAISGVSSGALTLTTGLFNVQGNAITTGNYNGNISTTSGTVNGLYLQTTGGNASFGFNPTSGTAIYNSINIGDVINQTGTATGVTRGLFVNPTLTSAADFRSIEVNNGRVMFNQPSLVSQPAQQFTGAWFTGGTGTTTKPHVLIEPSGATSTGWNTNGTGLGINSANGFNGNLIDLQLNGVSRLTVSAIGSVLSSTNITANGNLFAGSSGYIGISGRSGFNSTIDAGFLCVVNQNDNNFQRLQLGDTTSSFPALQVASSNAQTGLAATFTNGSADIGTATNTYAVGNVVQFTTTGTLPTGFAINTNYFVIATGLTTTKIQVSATSGGAAISAASAGSGTHTVTRQNVCTFTNGSSTIVTTTATNLLRAGDLVRFSNTGGAVPTNIRTDNDYYVVGTPTTTSFQVSSTFGSTAITFTDAGTDVTTVSRPIGIYNRFADNSGSGLFQTESISFGATPANNGRINFNVNGTTVADGISWGPGQLALFRSSANTLRIKGSGTNRYLDISVQAAGTVFTVNGNTTSSFSLTAGLNATKSTLSINATDGGISFTNPTNSSGSLAVFQNSNASSTGLLLDLKNSAGTVCSVSSLGAVESLYQRFGSGSPEGVVTAPPGAIYHNTDGGAGTSLYVKESGTGNTGWISK